MEYHERESATLKIERDHWREQAKAWEAVAKNLAQVIEGRDGDGVLTLSQQVKAHGLMGTQSAPAIRGAAT